MSAEANKAVLRRLIEELFNKQNLDIVDELFSPDFVEHEELPPGAPEGREAPRWFTQQFLAAFPDLQVTIDDLIAEGDKVVARETWTGTHKGDFMGMPATGRRISFGVIDIVRVEDGQLVEHWAVSDSLTMLQQLGAIPEPDAEGI